MYAHLYISSKAAKPKRGRRDDARLRGRRADKRGGGYWWLINTFASSRSTGSFLSNFDKEDKLEKLELKISSSMRVSNRIIPPSDSIIIISSSSSSSSSSSFMCVICIMFIMLIVFVENLELRNLSSMRAPGSEGSALRRPRAVLGLQEVDGCLDCCCCYY